MPYSVIKGELRTPGGCQVDEKRFIQAIRWEETIGWFEVDLVDGSQYHHRTKSAAAIIGLLTNVWDPGCVLNSLLRNGTILPLTKGVFPGRRNRGRKMTALPPAYIPMPI